VYGTDQLIKNLIGPIYSRASAILRKKKEGKEKKG